MKHAESAKRTVIAERLKEARKLAGVSQGHVAKILGLHRPSISEIEAGNRRVSADELARLAKIYDVGVAWLLGEAPDTLDAQDPRLELAARELTKLKPDDLDRLLKLLAAMRSNSTPNAKRQIGKPGRCATAAVGGVGGSPPMNGARLMAILERANDAGGRCALRCPDDAHRQEAGSYRARTPCASAPRVASAARGAQVLLGATPPSGCLVRHRGGPTWARPCHPPPGVAPDQRSFQEGCSAPLRGGGSPVLPTVQPVCLRYRRGPGADPRRTPDRGLPGTSSHESVFRIPGDVGMRESPGSRVPGSISSPVLSRPR